MDGAHTVSDLLSELDGTTIVGSWRPDLSRALLHLDARLVPVDRQILSPFCEAVARSEVELTSQAQLAGPMALVSPPSGIYEAHPASSTLFALADNNVAGVRRLAAIGLRALLGSSGAEREQPKRLLGMVRGALGPKESALAVGLGAISSIPEMVRIIEAEASTRNSLSKAFMSLWESWLHETLVRWMLAESTGLRHAMEPQALVPDLEGPQVPVAFDGEGAESALSISTSWTLPIQVDGTYTAARLDRGRAASSALERQSEGDLFAPSSFRLPAVLDESICRAAVVRASNELANSPESAAPYIGLALLLGGGVREIDLPCVVWGGPERAQPLSIAEDSPVLYRLVKRPIGAVVPSAQVSSHLEVATDVFAWPLPPSIHALLLRLTGGEPVAGRPVLRGIGSARNAQERMHQVIRELAPDVHVGALAPRFVLACEISAVLGSEMAQLAMADTFGMSPIPGYYSSLPETEVAEVIAQIQSRRFGETVPVPTGRPGWLGSRLTLTAVTAQFWPVALRNACRASEKSEDLLGAWKAHRDRLAAALCSATGHRPEDALGRIHLADVIPEYGLVILQDKQVDALRSARVAATGRLWLSELRRYLDRLIDLARTHGESPAGALGTAILKSEAPLFSVVDDAGIVVPLTAAELRASMPPELQGVDNFFRHRLNQCLLAKGVDPELRHAQMGWVVTSAHLFAELSPRSPADLGALLGPTIDDVLVTDGWYAPSARKRSWTWDGVPMAAARDWEALFRAGREQHEVAIKRVRVRLKERWKEFEADVLARLGNAVREFCPMLELDLMKPALRWAPGYQGVVSLTSDHHALICDRVRLGDHEPGSALEAAMARILLYRLVRRARAMGVVQGPIPSRPIFKITSDPSPFVPGIGVAVRHVFRMRSSLQRAAKSVRGRGALTAWSVLAHSIYRRNDLARAATGAVRTLVRARARSHVVRVAAPTEHGVMHMVFSGIAATQLAKRRRHARTARPPSREDLDAWALKFLADGVDWGDVREAPGHMESAFAAAACVELSGIERLLARAGPDTAAEDPVRCLQRDDGWPASTASGEVEKGDPPHAEPGVEVRGSRVGAVPSSRRDYDRFVALLNKRSFPKIRNQGKKTARATKISDGAHSWRRSLKTHLTRLQGELDAQSNLRLLIDYTLNHLQQGSEAGNQLAHRSLHREITQIGWPLLSLAAERRITQLDERDLLRLYREVLLSKTSKGRPYVLEELRRFHQYLVRAHVRQPVEWGELASLAGARQLSIEPALVTPRELDAIDHELQEDYRKEVGRPDASPEFLRLATLRRLFFLVLEASGIRPGSAYGLALNDLHLLGDGGDFVHVRRGDYGEAKTGTSLGFVPLIGVLWERNREWVKCWLAEQRGVPVHGRGEIPLFSAHPAGRQRVHDHHLTKRLNVLLKWATSDRKASCYWLRKTRITERFHKAAERSDLTARDVYGALITSGHAWIEVTVERYINDPCCLVTAELTRASSAPRSAFLAHSSLPAGPIDAAWSRAPQHRYMRSQVLLDRLGVEVVDPPEEMLHPPPLLRRFKELQPSHLDAYARALRNGAGRMDAAIQAGITQPQVQAIENAAIRLFEQRQLTPWPLVKGHTARQVLAPPRILSGTEAWFDQLAAPPPAMLALANIWGTQPSATRLYGEDVIARLDGELAPVVSTLLADTKIKAKIVLREHSYFLIRETADDNSLGHAAAVHWVLAIVWIHDKVRSQLNTAPAASAVSHPATRYTCS